MKLKYNKIQKKWITGDNKLTNENITEELKKEFGEVLEVTTTSDGDIEIDFKNVPVDDIKKAKLKDFLDGKD